jgi:hypothetical protein
LLCSYLKISRELAIYTAQRVRSLDCAVFFTLGHLY